MKKLITVKPNAKRQSLTEADDGSLIIRLTSPPVDGKANQELNQILGQNRPRAEVGDRNSARPPCPD